MRNSFRALLSQPLKEKTIKKVALTALLIAFVAAPAVAADFYAGVKLGSVNNSVPTASESSSGFGVLGGYTINPNFAVEVGYTDLGSVVSGLVTFKAFEVSVLGFYPVNPQFSLFGKLGMASTDESLLDISKTRSAITYGLGVQFDVNKSAGFRLGFDHYSFGGGVFVEGDIDLYSVAAVLKF